MIRREVNKNDKKIQGDINIVEPVWKLNKVPYALGVTRGLFPSLKIDKPIIFTVEDTVNANQKLLSLDFECTGELLKSGIYPKCKIIFRNTRESILEVLSLFDKNGIHATWATVGFLFAKNKKQLESFIPSELPSYSNKNLDYYSYFFTDQVGINEEEDPFHFACSIIEQILRTPHQELASHTFTHYYCNESGQNIKQFEKYLEISKDISN